MERVHILAARYIPPNSVPTDFAMFTYFCYQVLVYDDVIGSWSGHKAKFVRHFADSRQLREKAIQNYGEAVKARSFPDPEAESYAFNKLEWSRFLENQEGEVLH